jgi:hypothetical protein
MRSTIGSVVCGCYRFDSSGRGPSNGLLLLLSLSVDRRRLWPAILGSDEGTGDLLNRPDFRCGSSFSLVVRWKRLRARPSAGDTSQCLHGAYVLCYFMVRAAGTGKLTSTASRLGIHTTIILSRESQRGIHCCEAGCLEHRACGCPQLKRTDTVNVNVFRSRIDTWSCLLWRHQQLLCLEVVHGFSRPCYDFPIKGDIDAALQVDVCGGAVGDCWESYGCTSLWYGLSSGCGDVGRRGLSLGCVIEYTYIGRRCQ